MAYKTLEARREYRRVYYRTHDPEKRKLPPTKTWKHVSCLKCDIGFDSWGPANRICSACQGSEAYDTCKICFGGPEGDAA